MLWAHLRRSASGTRTGLAALGRSDKPGCALAGIHGGIRRGRHILRSASTTGGRRWASPAHQGARWASEPTLAQLIRSHRGQRDAAAWTSLTKGPATTQAGADADFRFGTYWQGRHAPAHPARLGRKLRKSWSAGLTAKLERGPGRSLGLGVLFFHSPRPPPRRDLVHSGHLPGGSHSKPLGQSLQRLGTAGLPCWGGGAESFTRSGSMHLQGCRGRSAPQAYCPRHRSNLLGKKPLPLCY